MITPVIVANNFIKRGQDENVVITPLKLQKLVYFLFRKCLQQTEQILFSERFETWTKGPVIPSIYTEFSSYKGNPIKTYAKDSQDNCFIVKETGVFKECIDYVWEKYKNYSGDALSELTHRDGTAWSIAKEANQGYLNVEDIKNESEQF